MAYTFNDTDWTVDRAAGDIRYIGDTHATGTPTYDTVINFHRWLQDLADDAVAAGDDELDITNENPSARSTDNIITLLGNYNIDDASSEHLFDGSIIQSGGDTVWDGIVNFGNADVQIQIIQDGVVTSDDWWNQSGVGVNPSATAGISHRFMLKVTSEGSDIDGRRILGTCRRNGFTYSEFLINGSSRGNNVLALSDASDLNNTSGDTAEEWGISNTTPGYVAIDVNNDAVDEYFYSEWDRSTFSINDLYEYAKAITRDGGDTELYGISAELFRGITHQVSYTSLWGTFDEGDSITWGFGDTSGVGQVLADSGDTVWFQLFRGVAPTATSALGLIQGGDSATIGAIVDRSATISTPFIGASTGSAIIGAYGVGIEYLDLTNNDTLFDLKNVVKNPPNNVTNTVTGLIPLEDRVLVAPWDGSATDVEGNPAILKNQLTLKTYLNSANATFIEVGDSEEVAIPADTPATGTIRVLDNDGFERRLEYSSWTAGDTFIISSTDGNEDFDIVGGDSGNNVYITYGDTLPGDSRFPYTGVYSGNRNLVVVVRDGDSTPIKEFISAWSFADNNQSISVIRTTDE